MAKCLIKREDEHGYILMGLGIGCNDNFLTGSIMWTNKEISAYEAENEDTAQAVIDFIRDVIDWELAEQLIIIPVNEEGRG